MTPSVTCPPLLLGQTCSLSSQQVKGSDWLGDQDAIHYMCREAPKSVIEVCLLCTLLTLGNNLTISWSPA